MPIESYFDDISIRNEWDDTLQRMEVDSAFARHIAHYRHPGNKKTALHYAAKAGNLQAVKQLIRHGAAPLGLVGDSRPVDLAREGGHSAVASLLYDAQTYCSGNWSPPEDSSLWPSSNWWKSAQRAVAKEEMKVAYAGEIVSIPQGAAYYEDGCGRVLVGWHGSYNPPLGMDGDNMIVR